MLVFISGGVRSGKSTLGEKFVNELAKGNKVYLATARPNDEEMRRRIRKHQKDREPKEFITKEQSENIGEIVTELKSSDTVLMDCLGNLVANEMFRDYHSEYTNQMETEISEKIFTEITAVNSAVENLIIISNEVFSSGITYDPATEAYLEVLGLLHIRIVAAAQRAVECAFGITKFHKGGTS